MSAWVQKKTYNSGTVTALECTFDTVADLKALLANHNVPDDAWITAECTCERNPEDSVRHIEIKWENAE